MSLRDENFIVHLLLLGCQLVCKPVTLCVGGWVSFYWFVDLEAKERVMEDMRLALTEQEETQEQMEQVLEEKLNLIQELSSGKTQDLNRMVKKMKISLFGIK